MYKQMSAQTLASVTGHGPFLEHHLLTHFPERLEVVGRYRLGLGQTTHCKDPLSVGHLSQRRPLLDQVVQVSLPQLTAKPAPKLLNDIQVWTAGRHVPKNDFLLSVCGFALSCMEKALVVSNYETLWTLSA